MSEMVERVAEAIYEVTPSTGGSNVPHKPHGESYRWAEWKAVAPAEIVDIVYRKARVAITALGEPTAAMLAALSDAIADGVSDERKLQRVIDTALTEDGEKPA